MKADKKALSLIEIVVATTMIVPLVVVANNYFKDTMEVNTYKNRIVKEKQETNTIDTVRKIIKEGKVRENGTNVSGVVTTNNQFKFSTTYFSDDVSHPDWFSVACVKSNDGTNTFNLVGTKNNEGQLTLIDNLKSCNIQYYNSANEETLSNISSVKISLSKIPFNVKKKDKSQISGKSVTINASMLHNS